MDAVEQFQENSVMSNMRFEEYGLLRLSEAYLHNINQPFTKEEINNMIFKF